MEASFNTPVKSAGSPSSLYGSPHRWLPQSPLSHGGVTPVQLTDALFSAGTPGAVSGGRRGRFLDDTLDSSLDDGELFRSPYADARDPAAVSNGDRFISCREMCDPTVSHFLLTSKENATPAPMQPPPRPGTASSAAAVAGSAPRGASFSPYGPGSPLARGGGFSASRSFASPSTRASSVNDAFTKLRLESSSLRETSNSPPNAAGGESPPQPPLCGPDTAVVEAEPYSNKLARTLFSSSPQQTSVLGLHSQPPPAAARAASHASAGSGAAAYESSLGVVFEGNRTRNFRSKTFRVIAQTPERILDAADMVDDFYLNLIDWSSSDVLAVALQSVVYLWDAATCDITQLPSTRSGEAAHSTVCSVSWAGDGRHLAVGLSDGVVEVWDVEAQAVVRSWFHHGQRVSTLGWSDGGSTQLLASGSKDTSVRVQDVRERPPLTVLRGHQQEVCGLRWSASGTTLATGGNDNQLLLWDRRRFAQGGTAQPSLYLNQHTAAVKALAWNPAQPSLLASGGGTDDKTLRFWNTLTGECLHSVDTQSQVCGVLWNRQGTELVSSHGFSRNQLTVWKYPSLRRLADLTGHTSRVLHLCLSADGEVVVSAAGDETIRFWRCFPPDAEREASPLLHRSYGSASAGSASPLLSSPAFAPPPPLVASVGRKRHASGSPHSCLHADPHTMRGEYDLR